MAEETWRIEFEELRESEFDRVSYSEYLREYEIIRKYHAEMTKKSVEGQAYKSVDGTELPSSDEADNDEAVDLEPIASEIVDSLDDGQASSPQNGNSSIFPAMPMNLYLSTTPTVKFVDCYHCGCDHFEDFESCTVGTEKNGAYEVFEEMPCTLKKKNMGALEIFDKMTVLNFEPVSISERTERDVVEVFEEMTPHTSIDGMEVPNPHNATDVFDELTRQLDAPALSITTEQLLPAFKLMAHAPYVVEYRARAMGEDLILNEEFIAKVWDPGLFGFTKFTAFLDQGLWSCFTWGILSFHQASLLLNSQDPHSNPEDAKRCQLLPTFRVFEKMSEHGEVISGDDRISMDYKGFPKISIDTTILTVKLVIAHMAEIPPVVESQNVTKLKLVYTAFPFRKGVVATMNVMEAWINRSDMVTTIVWDPGGSTSNVAVLAFFAEFKWKKHVQRQRREQIPEAGWLSKEFGNDSSYSIMYGPDKWSCNPLSQPLRHSLHTNPIFQRYIFSSSTSSKHDDKEAIPTEDSVVLSKIHQTCRIGYENDVILPRVVDEATTSNLSFIIQSEERHLVSTGAADILILFFNQDPNILRSYVVQQDENSLLRFLVSYIMYGSQRDTIIEVLYERHLDQFSSSNGNNELYSSRELEILSNICELLCFSVLHNPYSIKWNFLMNKAIEKVLCLTRIREIFLVVAVVRFICTVIFHSDLMHLHFFRYAEGLRLRPKDDIYCQSCTKYDVVSEVDGAISHEAEAKLGGMDLEDSRPVRFSDDLNQSRSRIPHLFHVYLLKLYKGHYLIQGKLDPPPLSFNGTIPLPASKVQTRQIFFSSRIMVSSISGNYHPVGEPTKKDGDEIQALGEAIYVDDIPSQKDYHVVAFFYATRPLTHIKKPCTRCRDCRITMFGDFSTRRAEHQRLYWVLSISFTWRQKGC